ncbi:unnamed protein product [Rotaria sp. Silwood1]|nr:unnamed protein product [Rotaria sp. Silwood1]CAF3353664.1 unnamed protein product [Rotaria sp. Silwood1]CAF3381019.1 unnamed protein product [Rotaria sp. Silwood1]CAF4518510.1 unnamed protein product [Rotaria sp. Silwood1]CAF4647989.1 unnamed protein product [Rotaria sp. Silwood1]
MGLTSTTNVSTDNDGINNIDPLIEPLIDADELIATIDNDETLHRFEQKCLSILTLHSPKENRITPSSGVISRCTGIIYALIGAYLTTCRYTQVIWTAILAMIIFRERISMSIILAIILTLISVILVTPPTFLFDNHKLLSNTSKIIIVKSNHTNFESNHSYRLLDLCLALGCALSILFIIFTYPILNHVYNRSILYKYVNHTMFTWQFFLAASVSSMQVFSSTLIQ